MKTIYDVQQLLKRFGIFIYTGNRIADLELMKEEVKDLYHSHLIDIKLFQRAILVLRREINQQKK